MIRIKPLRPEEAVAFFRQKGFKIGFDYRDVWQAEHQSAFTVAKVMKLGILKDIRAAVDQSLSEGITFDQFAKDLEPTLVRKGWWGRADMIDPITGELRDVQLGSPRRLKTIYDTNLRTAHSEGRWQRIQSRKDSMPWLQYDANNSADPRKEHSAWDGLVLPVDDPWWVNHYPVKQYGCKCRVIQRSQRQLDRRGLRPGEPPKEVRERYLNKRTGEISMVPRGVDPSFDYPVGGRRASILNHARDVLETEPRRYSAAAIREMLRGPAFATWATKPTGDFTVGLLSARLTAAIDAQRPAVLLSANTWQEQQARHPEVDLTAYALIPDIIDGGEPIRQGRTLVFTGETGAESFELTLTRTDQSVWLESYRLITDE